MVLSLAIAACGGGSSKSTSTKTQSTTTTTSTTSTTSPATTPTQTTGQSNDSASVTTGPVHGTLTAENHAPVVNQPWAYSVKVTDAAGKPLSGTVDIEFVFGGMVVGRDTPPTHPIRDGSWHAKLKFPAAAVGQPLTFRTVVHTSKGSITLDWPITVKKS